MGLIHARGVRKEFDGLVAVDDLDLVIEPGEIHGLIGPNGSGKTTLLNLMSGWLRPTRGSLVFDDEVVTGVPPHRLAQQGIGRTFQLPTLFREMTSLENVVLGAYQLVDWNLAGDVLGLPRQRQVAREAREVALQLLQRMGIDDVRDELAGSLPLGHQRWLGMAIALSTKPKLLMLDEPLGGMNPVERSATMAKIRMLAADGITILLVEHDMHAVMGTCGVVTAMNAGRKIAQGTPDFVRADPLVIDAYLGTDDDA